MISQNYLSFGFRTRKTTLQPDNSGTTKAKQQEGIEATFPVGEGEKGKGSGPVGEGEQPGQTLSEDKKNGTEPAKPISRVGPRGPKITFVEIPDRNDLAWVDGNNVVINNGHPSYVKVRSDATARRLHNLFAIASAVQRFMATESEIKELMFIDKMMAVWGKKK